MRSGRNNTLVDIWQMVETIDPDYNTPIFVSQLWKEDVFCNATPRRGREVEIDGQVVAETYMKFDFEYYEIEGISGLMFIVHEATVYDIKAILHDLALKEWTSLDTVARALPEGRS